MQAVGGGAMVPASLAILLATVPAPARAQAIGTWSALGALGAALGPVIGGLLVGAGWRWVFWINLPVGLAAIVLALRTLPESRDERVQSRRIFLGATLLAAGVGLVALTLVKAPDWGWGSPRWLGGLTAALLRGGGSCPLSSPPGPRNRARPASLTDVQRNVCRLTSLLRGLRRFHAQLRGVPDGCGTDPAVRTGLAIAPAPLVVLPFARLLAPRLIAVSAGRGGWPLSAV